MQLVYQHFLWSSHTPVELYATIEQRHSLVHVNLLHYFLFLVERGKRYVHTVPSHEIRYLLLAVAVTKLGELAHLL